MASATKKPARYPAAFTPCRDRSDHNPAQVRRFAIGGPLYCTRCALFVRELPSGKITANGI